MKKKNSFSIWKWKLLCRSGIIVIDCTLVGSSKVLLIFSAGIGVINTAKHAVLRMLGTQENKEINNQFWLLDKDVRLKSLLVCWKYCYLCVCAPFFFLRQDFLFHVEQSLNFYCQLKTSKSWILWPTIILHWDIQCTICNIPPCVHGRQHNAVACFRCWKNNMWQKLFS